MSEKPESACPFHNALLHSQLFENKKSELFELLGDLFHNVISSPEFGLEQSFVEIDIPAMLHEKNQNEGGIEQNTLKYIVLRHIKDLVQNNVKQLSYDEEKRDRIFQLLREGHGAIISPEELKKYHSQNDFDDEYLVLLEIIIEHYTNVAFSQFFTDWNGIERYLFDTNQNLTLEEKIYTHRMISHILAHQHNDSLKSARLYLMANMRIKIENLFKPKFPNAIAIQKYLSDMHPNTPQVGCPVIPSFKDFFEPLYDFMRRYYAELGIQTFPVTWYIYPPRED